MSRVESTIDKIIRREGSKYTNRPNDRGGPTKYGITLATLRDYRRRQGRIGPVTAWDVQVLTEAEARAIYADIYVKPYEFVRSVKLRELLIDAAVQHWHDDPAKWLQESLGVKVDGKIGPITRRAVDLADQEKLYRQVLAKRIQYYGELITKDHKQAENAWGWMNRVSEFVMEI